MPALIKAERMVVSVPRDLYPSATVAKMRALTYAHFATGMGTPVAEEIEELPTVYRVTIVELGSAEAFVAARSERA